MQASIKAVKTKARCHGFKSTRRRWTVKTQSVNLAMDEMVLAYRPSSKLAGAYAETDFWIREEKSWISGVDCCFS